MAISATAGWPHLSVELRCVGAREINQGVVLDVRSPGKSSAGDRCQGASISRWKYQKKKTVLLNKNGLRTVAELQDCFLQAFKPSVSQCWAKAGEEGYVMGLGGEPECIGSLCNCSLRNKAGLSSLEIAETEETATKAQNLWQCITSISICTQVCLVSPRESVSVLVDTYLF